MIAKIEKGKLIIEANLQDPAPKSKSGKTRVPVSTNGFLHIKGDDDKDYQLSINLIVKD